MNHKRKMELDRLVDNMDNFTEGIRDAPERTICLTILFSFKILIGVLTILHQDVISNIPMPEEK